MNEVTMAILKAVLAAVAVVVTYYVKPILKMKYEQLVDEKTRKVIREAVDAFEQSIKGSGKGELKKENVTNFVTKKLKKMGIYISSEELSILIEAAVKAMNDAEKLPPAVVNLPTAYCPNLAEK